MPNRDGTGPRGEGPKTGRQRGNCEGAQNVGNGFGQRRRCPRKGFGFRQESQVEKN